MTRRQDLQQRCLNKLTVNVKQKLQWYPTFISLLDNRLTFSGPVSFSKGLTQLSAVMYMHLKQFQEEYEKRSVNFPSPAKKFSFRFKTLMRRKSWERKLSLIFKAMFLWTCQEKRNFLDLSFPNKKVLIDQKLNKSYSTEDTSIQSDFYPPSKNEKKPFLLSWFFIVPVALEFFFS